MRVLKYILAVALAFAAMSPYAFGSGFSSSQESESLQELAAPEQAREAEVTEKHACRMDAMGKALIK